MTPCLLAVYAVAGVTGAEAVVPSIDATLTIVPRPSRRDSTLGVGLALDGL
jgi:hypothetical protein